MGTLPLKCAALELVDPRRVGPTPRRALGIGQLRTNTRAVQLTFSPATVWPRRTTRHLSYANHESAEYWAKFFLHPYCSSYSLIPSSSPGGRTSTTCCLSLAKKGCAALPTRIGSWHEKCFALIRTTHPTSSYGYHRHACRARSRRSGRCSTGGSPARELAARRADSSCDTSGNSCRSGGAHTDCGGAAASAAPA